MTRWSTLGAALFLAAAPGCKSKAGDAPPGGRKPPPSRSVTAVVNGDAFACALVDDGTVRCWGANDDGQLGDGTRERRAQPTLVSGAGDVVEIAAGARHACARLRDGSVLCWGANELGQLGDGTHERRLAPAEVVDAHAARGVTAQEETTCVTAKGKKEQCFGEGRGVPPGPGCSVAGDAGLACESVDGGAAFEGLPDAVAVAPHATAARGCALMRDGSVACWGEGAWAGVGGPPCARPFVRYVRVDRVIAPVCDDAGPPAAPDGGGD